MPDDRATEPSADATRPCTCHSSDNPPVPCPQKFAYSECVRASYRAIIERLAASRPRAGTGFDAGYVAACEEILREMGGEIVRPQASSGASVMERAKAALQPWYDAPVDWAGEDAGLETAVARAIEQAEATARTRTFAEVRQIIDDVNSPPLTDPPGWSNACTAIDNRVRLLADKRT